MGGNFHFITYELNFILVEFISGLKLKICGNKDRII